MKLSDEIRELIDDEDLYPRQIAELRRIADRIDAEHEAMLVDARKTVYQGYIELPKDADGVPIHVGDTVYGCRSGMKMAISELRMTAHGWSISTSSGYLTDAKVTHTRPDSLESIARDLEDWAEGNISGSAQSFADRIRTLAKKEGQK